MLDFQQLGVSENVWMAGPLVKLQMKLCPNASFQQNVISHTKLYSSTTCTHVGRVYLAAPTTSVCSK